MRIRNYIILIWILFGLIPMGCSKKSTSLSSSRKTDPANQDKKDLSISSTHQRQYSDEAFQIIQEMDIFTPSELRKRAESGNLEIVEIKYEPQKLTITGIVFDGDKYLVSVENMETGDSEYLGENEKIAGSTIQSVDDEVVKVKKKDFILTYKVGDQIPLEGTASRSRRSTSGSTIESSSSVDTIQDEEDMSIPPAANSIEEMLRQRRLQEEEELK